MATKPSNNKPALDRGEWSSDSLHSAAEVGEWPGAFEAMSRAFLACRFNLLPLLFYFAVIIGAELVIRAASGQSLTANHLHQQKDTLELLPFGLIFLPYLISYELALAEDKAVSVGALWRSCTPAAYLKMLVALLLSIVLIVAGALPLLIGLIWIIPWVSLLFFPVMDRGYGPAAALREVRQLSEGHKSKVWSLVGIGLLLSLAGSLLNVVPIVGTLVSVAITFVNQTALAMLYLWLRARDESA